MIRQYNNLFVLDTDKTTYAFALLPTGHLEHLYYGSRLSIDNADEVMTLFEKRIVLAGNAVCYSAETPALGLEDVCLEMSSYGKGDIREPFIEVTHADGSFTSDFLFEKAEIIEGKRLLETLPSSYAEDTACTGLVLTLKDKQYELTLELTYHVFEQMNVITRSAKLINTSSEKITLERLMSTQLDLADDGWILSSFHGAWAREMNRVDMPTGPVKVINSSYCGVSSNRSNPFVMLSRKETTEMKGRDKMKIFVDTGKIEDIKKANDLGVICGVTTNPSLIAKEGGRSQEEILKEIASIVDGPISGEVKATTVDAEGMIAEGREIAKLHPNMVE